MTDGMHGVGGLDDMYGMGCGIDVMDGMDGGMRGMLHGGIGEDWVAAMILQASKTVQELMDFAMRLQELTVMIMVIVVIADLARGTLSHKCRCRKVRVMILKYMS